MSEVITRDDMFELTCGHLVATDGEIPTSTVYCAECGLYFRAVLAPDDIERIVERARLQLEKDHERLVHQLEARNRVDKPLGDNIEGRIEDIRRAIMRIEAGTFGFCSEPKCNAFIGEDRLYYFPYAELCLSCKSKSEGLPAPAGRSDVVPANESTPPARGEGDDGEASASPEPIENKTSSGAGPGERTYADLAIPKLHGGANVLQSIPVDKIKPSPDNPREDVGDVSGLAATIASLGRLINPITVTQNGDGYHLTTGHRRLAAVKSLGWDVVAANVIESSVSEQEIEEERLIENLQREDLTPLEEAKAYKRHLDKYGLSQKELSESVGRSQGHVSKRLALLDLPKKAIDLVVSGGITLEESQALHKLKEYPKRLDETLKSYRPDGYQSLEDMVARQLNDQKREEKRSAALKTLKDKGVKVVDSSITYQSRKAARLGKHYGELEVDKRKHASEPCHAAYLESYDSTIVTICTDTSRHSKKGASALKAKVVGSSTSRLSQSPKQRAEKERKRDLQAAAKARMAVVEKIIDGKKRVAKDFVIELVVLPLIVGDENRYAPELRVGADRICDRFSIDRSKVDPAELLAGLIENKQATTVDLALAIAIDNIEARLCPAFGDWDIDYRPYRPYLDWLERHGYELSGAELERLAVGTKGEAKK